MKRILGLDLGTNSIGWALIEVEHKHGIVNIVGLGSRILPMDSGEIGDFESKGKIISAAAQRTEKRGPRRLNERFLLRRNRLHLVLGLLEALPEHYKYNIHLNENEPIEKRKDNKGGQFKNGKELKLAFKPNKLDENKYDFLFEDTYLEMLGDMEVPNGDKQRVPKDWTLYYLRQKALKKPISLYELAWVLLSYNQKRGYEKTEVLNKATKDDEIIEELDLIVTEVNSKTDNNGKKYFEVQLAGNDNFKYQEYSKIPMTEVGDLKEVHKISKVDEKGEVDKNKTEYKVIDIYGLKLENVEYIKNDGKHEYTLTFHNEWKEVKNPKSFTNKYNKALGKSYNYIVETNYNTDGTLKEIRKQKRKLREPDLSDSSDDWTVIKKKTEKEALKYNSDLGFVEKSGSIKKFISPKIYQVLKKDAKEGLKTGHKGHRTKIIGGMFQVVDREFYREELNQIIETQRAHHECLNDEKDRKTFDDCVRLLYPKNESHRNSLLQNKKAIQYLMVEDILLYHRPLKSKKSDIGTCKYEIKYWEKVTDNKTGLPVEETDNTTGEIRIKKRPIFYKAVSVSHPLFQEFRIWDKIHNLKLIQIEKQDSDKVNTNVDVTSDFLSEQMYEQLFDYINNRKSITQTQFISFLKPILKECNQDYKNFVWNFPEDEDLKGNETRFSFITRFKRCGFKDNQVFLSQKKEIQLWHYLYSVPYKERTANDNASLRNFLEKFFGDFQVESETFDKLVLDFANYPKFQSRYCSYSEKALKKLLPFLRVGSTAFNGSFDNSETKNELEKIDFNPRRVKELLPNTKGPDVENKRQQLHLDIWKHSINLRVKAIRSKLAQLDFKAEEVAYSKVVENDPETGKPFPKGLFKAFRHFEEISDFKNLNLTQASYLVYGRHSELAQTKYWNSPEDIRKNLHQELKQHSLNNPVAEKVILEMMQIVADIWDIYGKNVPDYFHKIHLEVGRSLKKSASEKKKIEDRQKENRTQNKRIRQVLEEILSEAPYNAKPRSNDHFDRLKIMEDGAEHSKNLNKNLFDNKKLKKGGVTKKKVEEFLKQEKISITDFEKYKLWLEQGYKSPYTGRPIQLSKLFRGNIYNIDHVFARKMVTNDSLSNKVVCETEVNKLKGKQTGRDFILNPGLKNIYCEAHQTQVAIVSDDVYVTTVKELFSGTKRSILLSESIPKNFTSSQLNNARHISRKAMELLSHIVREPDEIEFRSKNVLPVTGRITSELKRAWRFNEVWAKLMAPRFIRMNELTQSNLFGDWQVSKTGERYFDCNLDKSLREKDNSYDIKRIDHRHHALDALIVALCTESHVNYINNINSNAKSDNYGKQKQIEAYREILKRKIMFTKPKKESPKEKQWYLMGPGHYRKHIDNSSQVGVKEMAYTYQGEAFDKNHREWVYQALANTIISFKQNLRVINKTVNYYQAYKDKNGNETKTKNLVRQKGRKEGNKENWAIRRSLGKDTYYGKVNLKRKDFKKLYTLASRIFENPTIIVDEELNEKMVKLISGNNLKVFKKRIKVNFPENPEVEYYYWTDDTKDEKVVASREHLSPKFDSKRIKDITDTGIQKILLNQLKQFDTVALPFEEAVIYYGEILEKEELEALIQSDENEVKSAQELFEAIRANGYIYDKTNFKYLNVYVDKVKERDFRNEKNPDGKTKFTFKEHSELAFSAEAIEDMNKPENLMKLNISSKGVPTYHHPIRKVRVSTGFGKQRALNPENEQSVKSKQFVVNDAGSNLFVGVYERKIQNGNVTEIRDRKFQEIGLIDLIEKLKQDTEERFNPVPNVTFDSDRNEYRRIFTLSPLDMVYVPTHEEIDNPNLVDFNNLSKNQVNRIYKYRDGGVNSQGGWQINFIPSSFSSVLKTGEIKTDSNVIKGEIVVSTPKDKQQRIISGYHSQIKDNPMIREVGWKLKVNRLGQIVKFEK